MVDARIARELYDEERRKRLRIQANVDDEERKQKQVSAKLSTAKTDKKNLEKTLNNLDRVIRYFDNNLPNQLEKANKRAKKSHESYVYAIHCSNGAITNASIYTAFYTRSKEEDPNLSKAYEICVKERNRVLDSIQELKSEITQFNSEMGTINNQIRIYKGRIEECSQNMNYYHQFF